MRKGAIALSSFAGALVCALGILTGAQAQEASWREIAWPFLRDAWPNGRAFECKGGDCGAGLTLVARVKNGFCDCSRGVYDDDEIDRVSDVYLVSPEFKPLATSLPRKLAGMSGRTRLYETAEARPASVLSLAGGRDCNAFVATAVAGATFPDKGVEAAATFINAPVFSKWIAARQGGG